MSRKSVMISDTTRLDLAKIKLGLLLKNDNDTIKFLRSVYEESKNLPKESLALLASFSKGNAK